MDKRKAITGPVIQAAVILAVFYAIETALVYLNVFPDYNMLLCADIVLRFILGTVSLVLVNNLAKQGEGKYPVKKLFSGRISSGTWLVIIPFIIYVSAPFFRLFAAYVFTTRVLATLVIIIIQQFATGFFEEATHRGLMMSGLIKNNTSTVRQRLFTVFIAGAFFGLSHAANIVFGENPLLQVPSAFLWGCFIAAVYMLTDNLLLVMIMHALSDSTFRIVDGLFGYVKDAPVCQAVTVTRNVIDYVALPLTAILICVFYDRLKASERGKRQAKTA